MKVFRSMVLEGSIHTVWQAVRSFDGVVNWNPGVTSARMEKGNPTEPGGIRHLDIVDGTVFREVLLALSDREYSYTYGIVEGPLPVRNYISTHRFLPITDTGQTIGIWEGWFDCTESQSAEIDHVVGDLIYINAMKGLNAHLKELENG